MLFSIDSAVKFDVPRNREVYASLLSRLFSNPANFEPYKPNENDDYFWTLDAGNDWKLKFFENYPDRFAITFRYQCEGNSYEQALAEWLKVRYKVKVLEESRIQLNNVTARVIRLAKFRYPKLWVRGDVPHNFAMSFGDSEPQGIPIASAINGNLHHHSPEMLKAEATLALFFPRIVGYRIVEIEEYELLEALPKNDETVEVFNSDKNLWEPLSVLHLDYSQIYQTKRPLP